MDPARTAEVLDRSSCYLKEFTLHYYPYYKANGFGPISMVNEALMREAVRKLVPHIVVAKKYGQTVRISEANSMTGMCGVNWGSYMRGRSM